MCEQDQQQDVINSGPTEITQLTLLALDHKPSCHMLKENLSGPNQSRLPVFNTLTGKRLYHSSAHTHTHIIIVLLYIVEQQY